MVHQAGVTLTTAIYSAFTNKPVRDDVAMTGEITYVVMSYQLVD